MSNNENNNNQRIIRCTICRTETLENDIPADAAACPKCGTESLPEFVDHDVDVRINWHELRVLCMWAKNWEVANNFTKDHTLPSIIDIITSQLEKYRPVDGAPLSLLGELTQVAEQFGLDATLIHGDEEIEIKGKKNLH